MALLDDILTQLVTDSVVRGATGWEIVLSYMPPEQEKMLAVYEQGGGAPDQTDGTRYDMPTFQVRGRGESIKDVDDPYSTLRAKMQEVFDSLNDSVISGYVYMFADSSAPIPIGYDANLRPEMTWNFSAMKAR